MNRRPCEVAGCAALRGPNTYSPFCQAHRLARTRHGHPLQKAVTFYELAPFMRSVRASVKRNPDSEVWPILRARWARLIDHANAIAVTRSSGEAFHRPTAQAASMVLEVARWADETRVCEVMLAIYVLEHAFPGRFRDDRAFRFTLVRRLRHLAPMGRGTYWNQKLQRTSSVYRDAPPRAVEVLGLWLAEVFGLAGRLIADAELKRMQAPAAEVKRMADAIAELQ